MNCTSCKPSLISMLPGKYMGEVNQTSEGHKIFYPNVVLISMKNHQLHRRNSLKYLQGPRLGKLEIENPKYFRNLGFCISEDSVPNS